MHATCRASRAARGGRGVEWTELQSRASSSSSSDPSSPASPTQLHPAPSGSIRLKGGTNRGLGKRITADHSTSVGKRPTEKFTQAVQALLSPANPPIELRAAVCADISQPCQPSPTARRLSWLSSAAPFICCTPRIPRGRGRSKWVFYLDCCALLWACQCRHPLRTTQSVTRSGCQSLLSSSSRLPEHLGPFAPQDARPPPPTLFRSPGPSRVDVHGFDARAGGETGLARRAICGPMSFCLCLCSPAVTAGTLTTYARRMTAETDAKLRGVPSAMPSATHSRQADRKPDFQAVLSVS